jgi:drug/metabolite transporter (DMT)-like permease
MSVPAAYLGIILIWSTTPLAIQWSSADTGFIVSVTGRMLIGTLLCLLLLRLTGQRLPWHRAALRTYAIIAVMIYGGILLTYWGAQFVPSGLISVLYGLGPFLTALAAALWLDEKRWDISKLLGMILALAGLALIFQGELALEASYGLVAILIAVVIHNVSTVWVKRLNAGLTPLAAASGGLCLALPLYLLTWWLSGAPLPEQWPLRGVAAILYLGVFASGLGFIFYYYVLKHLSAGKVALITLITPVLALYLGQTLNHESLHAHMWWGSAAVLSGLLLYLYGAQILAGMRTKSATIVDKLQT